MPASFNMPASNLIKLVRKNLLLSLRTSAGTTMFRHFYVRRKSDGKELDTMEGGELSCAFYVSGMLAIFGLIDHAHSVVATTINRMQEAGWQETKVPRPGAVAVWPARDGHEHIGFVLDADEYISNNLSKQSPQLHKQKLPDGRMPKTYYWHPALDQD
jgi:hypothetical protein